MATTKFFLDMRRSKQGGESPIMIAIRNCNTTAYVFTGIRISPAHWDIKNGCVVGHPQRKAINARLTLLKGEVDVAILSIANSMPIKRMPANEIKKRVDSIINPQTEEPTKVSFLDYFNQFIDSKHGGTAIIYRATMSRIRAFDPTSCDNLGFEDINNAWLVKFDAYLAQTSPSVNSRAIHLRNIRAVFNSAIDNDVTTLYPFRRFKIQKAATRKRSFNVDTLRRIFNHTCENKQQQKCLDFFKLTFMLIGINVVDLCRLERIKAGRVDYYRAKTHRLYSIKIEPEANEIIERYAGNNGLLLNFAEGYANYRTFFTRLTQGLKEVRKQLGLDELTTYWARHSWATIAASLDIPKETIAAALGHGGNTVTDIYISFDQKKVDDANRRVLDWVLYGKR